VEQALLWQVARVGGRGGERANSGRAEGKGKIRDMVLSMTGVILNYARGGGGGNQRRNNVNVSGGEKNQFLTWGVGQRD